MVLLQWNGVVVVVGIQVDSCQIHYHTFAEGYFVLKPDVPDFC